MWIVIARHWSGHRMVFLQFKVADRHAAESAADVLRRDLELPELKVAIIPEQAVP